MGKRIRAAHPQPHQFTPRAHARKNKKKHRWQLTMDKILVFSIMSSSPADIAGAGYATRLSWRSGGMKQQPALMEPVKQEEKVERTSRPEMKRDARFAPEFDGINCFESIVCS